MERKNESKKEQRKRQILSGVLRCIPFNLCFVGNKVKQT
jgi:hypothetical protein